MTTADHDQPHDADGKFGTKEQSTDGRIGDFNAPPASASFDGEAGFTVVVPGHPSFTYEPNEDFDLISQDIVPKAILLPDGNIELWWAVDDTWEDGYTWGEGESFEEFDSVEDRDRFIAAKAALGTYAYAVDCHNERDYSAAGTYADRGAAVPCALTLTDDPATVTAETVNRNLVDFNDSWDGSYGLACITLTPAGEEVPDTNEQIMYYYGTAKTQAVIAEMRPPAERHPAA